MLIKYFIPEDGDDQSHPNIFELHVGINKKPTLIDIKSVSTFTTMTMTLIYSCNLYSMYHRIFH